MTWDELKGAVTRAFDEWTLVDGDIRAFLRLGLAFADAEYARISKEAEQEPSEDGYPELIDVFEARVGNLHQHDFDWMLLSAVLRDAVTNFESYLEKAREEVLRHQGQPIEIPERLPLWTEFKRFFRQLGVAIESDDVRRVRRRRGFLTHRRGELRTEAMRKEFQQGDSSDLFAPLSVELSREDVVAEMDVLAEVVREIDKAAYRYTWGRNALPGLTP
jgi:hypothetical protein